MNEQVKTKLDGYGWFIIVATVVYPLILLAILLCIVQRLDIVRIWVYFSVNMLMLPAGIVIVARVNPDVLNHRGRWYKKKDTKTWDKILVRFFAVTGIYLPIVFAALDMSKYHWPVLGPVACGIGIVLCVVGNVILYWAMLVNRHFEATVRLQTDRNQTVVTDGPYRYVRHPGYVGAILWVLSGPLMLGSIAALIPAAAGCLLLVWRTCLEDRMLQKNLPGYADYAARVRYRLIRGIW